MRAVFFSGDPSNPADNAAHQRACAALDRALGDDATAAKREALAVRYDAKAAKLARKAGRS